MDLAPIILFAYNRPAHLIKTLDSLASDLLAARSELTIFIDGPKDSAANEDNAKISEVKVIAHKEKRFGKTTIVEREKNLGLAASVISGMNEVLSQNEKVIVLEDDLIFSTQFLTFMNKALDFYKNSPEVFSISGYMYPAKEKITQPFFLKFDSSWGWATWKRAWKKFNHDADLLLEQIRPHKKDFDFNNTYYFSEMLEAQKKGLIDSWSIRWYASIFTENGYTLFPPQSYVLNIGHDGSGRHSGKTSKFDPRFLSTEASPEFPAKITETERNRKIMENYFTYVRSISFSDKVRHKVLGIFKKKKK